MALFHYIETITNDAGDKLTGYYVKLKNSSGAYAALYSDNSSTPISAVSGVTDAAVSDVNGRVSIYVSEGSYTVEVFDKNDSSLLLDSIADVPMIVTYSVSAGDVDVVETHAALAALTAADNDTCILSYAGAPSRLFRFDSSDRSTQVGLDPGGIATIAPTSDPTGASGAWRLEYDGIIYAEWSSNYSSASAATDACHDAWEYLVTNGTDAKGWELLRVLTTRGFGDKNIKAEYADEASLPAVGTLSEYDVVYAQSEETLWRVKGGAYVQIQNRSLNGKSIFSRTVAKSAGFLLKDSMPAWEGFKFSTNDGRIENIIFNGNNPSTQWPGYAGLLNNPNTDVLVYIEGYGISWRNNMVRWSGGDGMHVKGIIGNGEFEGGDNVWQYNNGCGLRFLRGSSWMVSKGWIEGNDGPGFLLKHDMLAADSDLATAINYYKQSGIVLDNIYSENDDDAYPDVQIEGGHYAPVVRGIAKHGTGSDRKQIYLKNSADSDSIYQGCQGGLFELWGLETRVDIESEARGNTFIRQGDFWSNAEGGSWIFSDAGKDNICRYSAIDPHAYIPGHRISAITLNADSTNFVDEQAAATGTATVTGGGAYGPIHDYHPDYTTGPSFVRFSNMETRVGGGTTARCTARCNAAANSAQTYYAILSVKVQAHQSLHLVIYDQANNEYYNWDTNVFSSSGAVDDWGFQLHLRCEPGVLHYCIPFTGSAGSTTRSIRPEVRVTGSGTADAYHCAITDIPDSALFAVVEGVHMGAIGKTAVALASLPAATKVDRGTRAIITDGAASQVIGATVASGGSTRVPVNSDGTDWKVG